jgi:outer membrane protein TolC
LPNPAGRRDSLTQLDEAALIETAFRNRKDLQALTRFQEAADETLAGARNGDRPQVNLMVDTTQAMVRLSMPIGGGVQQGQVNEALAGQSESRLKLQELQAQIRRDIGTALAGARQYAGFWETLNRSQSLLEGVVADAQKRQQNGTISAQDYRLAQDELGRVRPQLIEAQLQYASSLADLHLLLGTIPVGEGVPAADVARMLQVPPAVLPP